MQQTIACIDGLGGCGLVRLTNLPTWRGLFDASKIIKIGMWRFALYHLGQDFEVFEDETLGLWVHRVLLGWKNMVGDYNIFDENKKVHGII
jgi:hypothetical protein